MSRRTEPPVISVILCTRNRAAGVRTYGPALVAAVCAARTPAELVVVDNGSTDDTAAAAAELRAGGAPVRVVSEPRAGLARARNRGIDAARGRVLLFTDDDVAVRSDWVDRLAGPLLRGEADAVTGPVVLAPHYQRLGLSPRVREMMASWPTVAETPFALIGANMGCTREVLAGIRFDPALGAPPYQSCEDSLFSWQLAAAGARIVGVPDAAVEHHFDADRLAPRRLLGQAVARGRANAYIAHHWAHRSLERPWTAIGKRWVRLALHRLRHPRRCDDLRLDLTYGLAERRELYRLRGTAPRYAEHGWTPLVREG